MNNSGQNNYQCKYSNEQLHTICLLLSKDLKSGQIMSIMRLPYDPGFSDMCSRIRRGLAYTEISCHYNIHPIQEKSSKDHIHHVCDLLEKDMSNKEIAAELGVPMNGRLKTLCAKLRSHDPIYQSYLEAHPNIPLVRNINRDEIEQMCQMKAKGLKEKQIAEEMAKTNPSINNRKVHDMFKRFETKPNAKGRDIAIKYGIIEE